MGPAVTARYGGAMMWLATISILFQVVYNIEISRYALYSGEPIMNGKFRTLPGPALWLWVYVLVDFAAIFPYLAANAATPLARLLLGRMPDSSSPDDQFKMRLLGYGVFLLCCTPMIFGGKIYKSLRALMTFKIITVLGFLLILALFYSTAATWKEIGLGFVRFGTIPTREAEDLNGNDKIDPARPTGTETSTPTSWSRNLCSWMPVRISTGTARPMRFWRWKMCSPQSRAVPR